MQIATEMIKYWRSIGVAKFGIENCHHRVWFAILNIMLLLFIASTYSIIHNIIIHIYMHNMQETTQYWWSYASAKFCIDSCHRSFELRRAITSSILVCWRHFLYWNVSHDSIYCLCDRGASKQRGQESRNNIVAWCQIMHMYIRNAITSSIQCLLQ